MNTIKSSEECQDINYLNNKKFTLYINYQSQSGLSGGLRIRSLTQRFSSLLQQGL